MASCRLAEPEETEVRRRPGLKFDIYELWTKNSVYLLDEDLRCFQVEDAASGAPRDEDRVLGTLLAGSREVDEHGQRFRRSLPPPGTYALFTSAEETVSITSKVLRLVKFCKM